MKKIFTLFAVAAMALSASAQDYTISYTDGTVASSADMFDALNNQTWAPVDGLTCGDIKMFLFHSDAKTYSGGNTWNGTDPADFNKKKPVKFSNGAANAIVLPAGVKIGKIEFIGYCNSTGATSWISTLGVAEGNTYKELYTNTGDESVAYMSKDDCTAGNALGKITVDLSKNPASDVIYFKNGGKQPAFFINLYKAADTPAEPELPIAPAHTEGQEFSLTGEFPQGEFGTIKTPLTIDYTAKTLTFNEFLGGNATLTFSYEQRDPNAELTPNETMFYVNPTSGVTEAGELSGATVYDLDGLKNAAVVLKNNDVNTIKLNAPQLVGGTWTCMKYMTGNKFEFTVYLTSKNQQWVNDNWGEESAMGYFRLVANVPASATPTAIEDILGEDENAPVEYYNLQGVRISEPAAGQVVIRRQGSKVAKIIVR